MSVSKFNAEGYFDPTAYEAMSAVAKEEQVPIIDTDSFEKAQAELAARAKKLGRTNKVGRKKEIKIPLSFSLKPVKKHYDNPFA